jgi:transposase
LPREILRDDQWQRIEGLLPGKPGDPGMTAANNRRFVEAMLWIAGTGAPWRDLPESFGNWNSTWRRFRRWTLKGLFETILQAMTGDPDFEYVIVDGTIVRVHQHGTGAKRGPAIRPLAALVAA